MRWIAVLRTEDKHPGCQRSGGFESATFPITYIPPRGAGSLRICRGPGSPDNNCEDCCRRWSEGRVPHKEAGGSSGLPPARTTRLVLEAPGCLRGGDGRAVAGRGDGERAGGARRVGVGAPPGRCPTRRRSRDGGHERTSALVEPVDRRGGQGGESRGQRTHVRCIQADGRGERPRVGLSL